MKPIILAMLVLAIVACTPSTDTQADTVPADSGIPAGPAETGPAPQAPTPSAPSAEPAKTDATSAFKTAMAKRSAYKVTYSLSATAAGVSTTGTLTQYFKDVDTMRTDTMASGVESRTYMLSGVVTSCTKATGNWMCFESDMPQDASRDIESGNAKYTVSAAGTKTVAGEQTTCYLVTTEEGYKVTYCLTSDSIAAYTKSETKGTVSELTATSISRSVSNADFVVPESTGGSGYNLPPGFSLP